MNKSFLRISIILAVCLILVSCSDVGTTGSGSSNYMENPLTPALVAEVGDPQVSDTFVGTYINTSTYYSDTLPDGCCYSFDGNGIMKVENFGSSMAVSGDIADGTYTIEADQITISYPGKTSAPSTSFSGSSITFESARHVDLEKISDDVISKGVRVSGLYGRQVSEGCYEAYRFTSSKAYHYEMTDGEPGEVTSAKLTIENNKVMGIGDIYRNYIIAGDKLYWGGNWFTKLN